MAEPARRSPRLTLLELTMIMGSVAVLPFAGPLGFGAALGGSACLAVAIRRSRRTPHDRERLAQLLLESRARWPHDPMRLATIGDYTLVEPLGDFCYRALPSATLDDTRGALAIVCEGGSWSDVERQLRPWRISEEPVFGGLLAFEMVHDTPVALFETSPDPGLAERLPLPRAQLGPVFRPVFAGLRQAQELDLGPLSVERVQLSGWKPRLAFRWKLPFDGRRCLESPWEGVGDLAPEQVLGSPSSPSTSFQFQLGTLMYVALSGEHPFASLDVMQTLLSLISDEPAPLNLEEPRLEAFILRLLRKEPEERFADLAAAELALLELLEDPA